MSRTYKNPIYEVVDQLERMNRELVAIQKTLSYMNDLIQKRWTED